MGVVEGGKWRERERERQRGKINKKQVGRRVGEKGGEWEGREKLDECEELTLHITQIDKLTYHIAKQELIPDPYLHK